MTRVEAIKKLLALGDLAQCDVIEIMGGDRSTADSALSDLVDVGDVKVGLDWSQGSRFCHLSDSARSVAFGGAHA